MENYKNTSIKNIVGERWKDVVGFEGLYQVSNKGRVKSLINYFKSVGIRILKQGLDMYGYPQVVLTKDGKKYPKKPHRLVAVAFIPNTENKPHINHKKGVKTDNRDSELEWVTPKENTVHSFKVLGRVGVGYNKGKVGELNWNSKKVNQIDLKSGEVINTFYGAAEASRILNISRRCIGRAASGGRLTYMGYKWEYV